MKTETFVLILMLMSFVMGVIESNKISIHICKESDKQQCKEKTSEK